MRYREALSFRKTGAEIKAAIKGRCHELEQRLEKRLAVLDEFLTNTQLVRSYLIRTAAPTRHGGDPGDLWSRDDISSEHLREIRQVCERVFEIQQELRRLQLASQHLADDQTFDLSISDLVGYGFNLETQS